MDVIWEVRHAPPPLHPRVEIVRVLPRSPGGAIEHPLVEFAFLREDGTREPRYWWADHYPWHPLSEWLATFRPVVAPWT